MTFSELLERHKEAIIRRWFERALETYPADAARAFSRRNDPFTNPVGHSLRVGTRGIFEVLIEGSHSGLKVTESEAGCQCLRDVIRIRAIQEIPASRAVSFVLDLKAAVRAELGPAAEDPRFASDLVRFERRIDETALFAVDELVRCREQVCELRVNEVKRRVSWLMGKMNGHGADVEPAPVGPGQECSKE
jgi:hypothetical protein